MIPVSCLYLAVVWCQGDVYQLTSELWLKTINVNLSIFILDTDAYMSFPHIKSLNHLLN